MHRVLMACAGEAFTTVLRLDPQLAVSLNHELCRQATNSQSSDAENPVGPVCVYEIDHPDHKLEQAIEALESVADDTLDITIKDQPRQPTSLHELVTQARELDAAAREALAGSSLLTLSFIYVRDFGGADDAFRELSFTVCETDLQKGEAWVNDILGWLENYHYAYASKQWIREHEPPIHASIQPALDHLATQMAQEKSLENHSWCQLLRAGIGVAHAQKRQDKTPELDASTSHPSRSRSRP